jgi:hypothetical protein
LILLGLLIVNKDVAGDGLGLVVDDVGRLREAEADRVVFCLMRVGGVLQLLSLTIFLWIIDSLVV